MIISNFTIPELNYIMEHCDFTDYEVYVFELRSQGKSLEQIAEILDLSIDKIKKLSRKVNRKIIKVL